MLSYIGGEYVILGIKWIGSKYDNLLKCNMECVSGVIILNDLEMNYLIVVMEVSLISSMCIVVVLVIVVKYLVKKGFKDLIIIGCGLIGDK